MKHYLLILLTLVLPIVSYSQDKEVTASINKFGQVLFYINNYYLDTTNVPKMTDKAIVALLKELDPHSTFISADEVKAANEPLQGEFDGIGVEFAIINDTLTVQAPVAGGPSERVGIRGGDKIVSVNGEKITNIALTIPKVHKYLRGAKGTKVDITIKRPRVSDSMSFTVTRDKIPLQSVDAAYLYKEKYLYIKLSRFAASSRDEIFQAINQYGSLSKGLILDLRGNSGGYLYSAITIANEFLQTGNVIVSTEGRNVKPDYEFANGRGIYKEKPVVVIIDENSASSSEIVAGALQDWDRAMVIGRRSFGKGLVQHGLPLMDGSQLRLTIARYHTPSGRVIQSPYKEGEGDKYYMRFLERYANGESFSKDSIHLPDSLKFKTLKKGRTVYGGGGIMPDIFVPQDTLGYSNYYSKLLMKGLVIDFMNDQCDKNRTKWKREYPNYEVFKKSFIINDNIFNSLIQYAKERGIEPNIEEIEKSKRQIKIYMKSLAASSIVGRETFYKVVNEENNPMFDKAIETLDNWDRVSF